MCSASTRSSGIDRADLSRPSTSSTRPDANRDARNFRPAKLARSFRRRARACWQCTHAAVASGADGSGGGHHD